MKFSSYHRIGIVESLRVIPYETNELRNGKLQASTWLNQATGLVSCFVPNLSESSWLCVGCARPQRTPAKRDSDKFGNSAVDQTCWFDWIMNFDRRSSSSFIIRFSLISENYCWNVFTNLCVFQFHFFHLKLPLAPSLHSPRFFPHANLTLLSIQKAPLISRAKTLLGRKNHLSIARFVSDTYASAVAAAILRSENRQESASE